MKAVTCLLCLVFALSLIAASRLCADDGAQPGPAEPDQGVRAILCTTMGIPVGLDAVRAAAERGTCKTVSFGAQELVFRFAGMSNNDACVRSNGEIEIRSPRGVAQLSDIDALENDLLKVYGFIEQVSTSIPQQVKNACLCYNLVYYLENPGVFKRLVFPPTGLYDGNLEVPQCEVKQARFAFVPTPRKHGKVNFRSKEVFSDFWGFEGPKEWRDVTDQTVFGAHKLRSEGTPYGQSIAVAFEAITSPTDAKIYFSGIGADRCKVTPVLPLSGSKQAAEQMKAQVVPQGLAADTISMPAQDVEKWLTLSRSSEDNSRALVARLHLWLGQNYLYRKDVQDVDAAIKALQRSAELDATCAQAHVALSHAYDAKGEAERRGAELKKALELEPSVSITKPSELPNEILVPRSRFEILTQTLDASISDTQAVAKSLPKMSGLLLIGTGYHSLRANKIEDAKARFEQAIKADPSAGMAYLGLAHCSAAKEDKPGLADAVTQALRLDPERSQPTSAVREEIGALLRPFGDIMYPLVTVEEPLNTQELRLGTDSKIVVEVIDDSEVRMVTFYVNGKSKGLYKPNCAVSRIALPTSWATGAMLWEKVKIEITAWDSFGKKTIKTLGGVVIKP